jgi:hypothetical protein
MADLPHPWGIYARLQKNLRRNRHVGDRSWGTEAGMDYILELASDAPPADDDVNQVINQVIATSRRRERYRDARRDPLLEDIATVHPEGALTARSELAAIRRKVGDRNWQLLTAVGVGSDYKEISVAVSASPGTVRVKILRLRASLAAAA